MIALADISDLALNLFLVLFVWCCIAIGFVVFLITVALVYRAYRRNHITTLDRGRLQREAEDLAAERGES